MLWKINMGKNLPMLWFDNDPRTETAAKIQKAADYYAKKYKISPNFCEINSQHVLNQEVPGIQISTSQYVLPNHFLIGRKE